MKFWSFDILWNLNVFNTILRAGFLPSYFRKEEKSAELLQIWLRSWQTTARYATKHQGEYFPSNLYVKMLSSRYIYIYNSPTGRVFFQILAPTALEIPISLSMICFYKCLVLENPPVPRKLQSLLSGKYGDSLELHVQTIGVWNSRKLVLGCLWVEFVSWEFWTYHIVSL